MLVTLNVAQRAIFIFYLVIYVRKPLILGCPPVNIRKIMPDWFNPKNITFILLRLVILLLVLLVSFFLTTLIFFNKLCID